MPGMPKRRGRQVAEYPPVDKAPDATWRALKTAAEKVEHLLTISLDRTYEILSVPLEEAREDIHILSAQMQALRVVILVAAKVGIENQRSKDRAAALDVLAQSLSPPHAEARAVSSSEPAE